MSAETLAAWLLSIMLSAAPPGKSRHPREARETEQAGRARYAAIARTIAEVSLDDEEAPVFAGNHARARTAAMLLAISYHESHWRRHVDLGLGPQSRGGGGRYHCMMQIAVPKGKTPEGWTAEQLVQSRERCFRRGLHILQRGNRYCSAHGSFAFVNHYASRRCDHGAKAVAKRVATYRGWLREHPPSPLLSAPAKR
jgi:hypothetical protein